jgi:hypothetical protein
MELNEHAGSLFVVFQRPPDMPASPYVVRRMRVELSQQTPTGDVWTFDTYGEVCAAMKGRGLRRFERTPRDAPSIVEAWL